MAVIPFLPLHKQNHFFAKALLHQTKNVIQSGQYILGPHVRLFEEAFAEYSGASHAIGVASGTDALLLSLKALCIGKGDGVLVPANSYPTAFAVAGAGATVQLADIDPTTYHLALSRLDQFITPQTKAIIAVHLYGNAVDMVALLRFARKRNLLVIEDCAQAHGAIFKGKKVGTWADVGCFSFYPTKNLGALGDGGMVVTNSKRLATKIRQLRMYGEKKRYYSVFPGYNSRLDELQAALLFVKLPFLDVFNRKRRQIAAVYTEKLQDVLLQVPLLRNEEEHVYHLYVVQTTQRKKLQAFLAKNGIETAIHYPVALYDVPAFRLTHLEKQKFIGTKTVTKQIVSLPCYPELTMQNVQRICTLVCTFFA